MRVFQWQNQFFVPRGDANLIANDRQMQNGGQRASDEFAKQMATVCSGMFIKDKILGARFLYKVIVILYLSCLYNLGRL